MKVNDVSDFVILYRGDSSLVSDFDISMTDFQALLGPGIYLTDSRPVATEYTINGNDHVVFPTGSRDGQYDTAKELIVGYIRHYIKNNLDWSERYDKYKQEWQEKYWKTPVENRDVFTKKEFQKVVQRAKRDYAKLRPNLRIVRHQHSYKFVKNDRDGYVTEFRIPREYLAKTLHTEQPLPDDVLNIIRDMFHEQYGNRKIDMRDLNEQFLTFDEYVENYRKHGTRYAWTDDVVVGGTVKIQHWMFYGMEHIVVMVYSKMIHLDQQNSSQGCKRLGILD